MKRNVSRLTIAGLLMLAIVTAATAQNAQKPLIPLKVQVVIARYEGDKKVSSLPYSMSVTANNTNAPRVSLRMGSQIPVPTTTYTGTSNDKPVTTYTYHNIGTNIDCSATTTEDGRYSVFVGIEDSSVMERRSNDAMPTLRSFSTQNTVVLREGQTTQFTAAADKTTGEVVKVDVTVTVEK